MPRDDRTYISLHDGMPEHPKVDALSDKGFRTLVELWCWCSRNLSDGFVAQATWMKRTTPKVRTELLAAGLVEVADGGVAMHDYLQHQRSKAEVQARKDVRRSSGEMGNHQRWHAERGIVDPACRICLPGGAPSDEEFPPDPGADASQVGSHLRSQTDRKTSPETDTEGFPSFASAQEGNPPPRDRSRDNPPPRRCPQHEGLAAAPPCIGCKEARLEREAWSQAQKDKAGASPVAPPCSLHPAHSSRNCPACALEAVPAPSLRQLRDQASA